MNNRHKGTNILKNTNPVDQFILEENSFDSEFDPESITKFSKPILNNSNKSNAYTPLKAPLSVDEQMLWYLKGIFYLLLIIGIGMLGCIITVVVLIAVGATSDQVQKAVTVVDKVFEMHDYTKTMTDGFVTSQDAMKQAIQDYNVDNMIKSVSSMVSKGDSLLKEMKPETFQQATTIGQELVNKMKEIDLEQGKQLMQNINTWATSIDPTQLKDMILQPMSSFLSQSKDTLTQINEQHLIKHISDVAASTVDLEARLQRLDEVTIKLPTTTSKK